jgi:hypothetical protein
MEGFHCTGIATSVACNDPSLTLPIVEYDHGGGKCSITGGAVYRGPNPALAARYVYADYCTGQVWSAAPDRTGAWRVRDVIAYGAAISTFGEDEQGELYFADYANGQVRRFVTEPGDRGDAIEYYHAALDHYFLSAEPSDIDALDAGVLTGWRRTGETVPAVLGSAPGVEPVCRFYIPPAQGDSHFLSVIPVECAQVRQRFDFVEEGPLFMHEAVPDAATGACPSGYVPVYRVWNQRADSNHRYTTDPAIRDRMVAQGGVAEGYGPDAVAMCAPAL